MFYGYCTATVGVATIEIATINDGEPCTGAIGSRLRIGVSRRRDGSRVLRPGQPGCKFVGIGINAAFTAGDAIYRETAFLLPAAHGALVAAQEGGNFLPGIEALIGCLPRGNIAHL